ncbi:hypothetical protein AUG19_06690 [archaeon 13_1_20CM_2_54_9]|nr:MAG: hypothetical protein AUJ07_09510 [Crenarchaeota archaeon 13_1_40CM_3_53_5]OLE75088.1 MAG: hypothetical protein AUG19_06690 [archaeon 13_1_20CM_2_54_9]
MVANRSRPPATVIPTLIYEDVGRAVEWLCGAFGFTERLRATGPGGKTGHAQLTVGNGAIMLGSQRTGQGFASPDRAEFRPPRPNEISHYISVHVEDVDQHVQHAKHFGARILTPPADHPFGERQYTAEDLAGHRWTFSQSIADVAPEKWGAVQANRRKPEPNERAG